MARRIELSDMIVGLRKELIEAQKKAKKEQLKFKVDSIDVEAQVTVSREVGAEGKVKWGFWIFTEAEAGLSGAAGRETVQTIRLKLTPDPDGGDPLKIKGTGEKPK